MVAVPLVTRRERGTVLAFGDGVGHRGRFTEGRAEGRRFVGARFAYRRLCRGGERLKDQHSEEDSPDVGSGEHSWDITSPHPGFAIEFAMNSHYPVFRGRAGALERRRPLSGRPYPRCPSRPKVEQSREAIEALLRNCEIR